MTWITTGRRETVPDHPEDHVAHHKRKRPKSSRAGCLLCKPHKRQGSCLHSRDKLSFRRKLVDAKQQINEVSS